MKNAHQTVSLEQQDGEEVYLIYQECAQRDGEDHMDYGRLNRMVTRLFQNAQADGIPEPAFFQMALEVLPPAVVTKIDVLREAALSASSSDSDKKAA